MSDPTIVAIGQRVRISTEPDGVSMGSYIGKMAVVKGLDATNPGERTCLLKIDQISNLVKLPETYLETLEPLPSSLLANDLFLPWDMNDPKPRLDAFVSDKFLAGHILETMMFYNRIIVPTVDFAIVVPLVHWLGPSIVKEMLESDALSFVRYRGGLGFGGGSVSGLNTFELHPSPENSMDSFWIRASTCPPAEAVILQLQNRLSGLHEEWIEGFSKLIEICTVETGLPEFTEKVENETYRDILGSQVLADRFGIEIKDPKNLGGISENQIRIFASLMEPETTGDPIDMTLRLGMLNLEAYLAEEAQARDMVTDRNFPHLLTAKVRRFTGGQTAHDGFFGITNIEDIPEVAGAIATGEIKVADAWEFRGKKSARDFREWFDAIGLDDPVTFQREYVNVLKSGSIGSGMTFKAIRLLVVQTASLAALPVAGPVGSMLASVGLAAVDSFLVDNILERIHLGTSPRYFIDDLRHNLFRD